MVKITIIGWYGTETIGDRAILAGLIRVFKDTFMDFEIQLGSIFPILSERTLVEDYSFFKQCSGKQDLQISIFNSLSTKELKKCIRKSDLLVVGGGPLMDITFMYMLEYAFKIGNKYRIKTALLGCGWGPLRNKEYINCALRIIKYSQLNIFRDKISLQNSLNYLPSESAHSIYSLIDPAFFAALFFKENKSISPEAKHIAINIRDMKLDQYGVSENRLEEQFCSFIERIAANTTQDIHLIPMHTFDIGGDDRLILGRLAKQIKTSNIYVQHNPLTLEETMQCYYDASFCVGMRFHSIVLQTILNGNNYILDYTDPEHGKIIGMLKELNILNFYKERYFSLSSDFDKIDWEFDDKSFIPDLSIFDSYMKSYVDLLTKMFS